MEILVRGLILIGIVLMIAGGVYQWVLIFRFSARWGWICILIPFAGLVFMLKYYDVIKKGFHLFLVGLSILFIGMVFHSYAL